MASDDEVASIDEIIEAIESLKKEDLNRLKRYGFFRLRKLGWKSFEKTEEDLVQEALERTLVGERHWNKKAVNFFGHLLGAIRSIATHWIEEFCRKEGRVKWKQQCEEAERDLFDGVKSSNTSHEDQLIAAEIGLVSKNKVEMLFRHFEEDGEVTLIMECFRDGMTGREIKEGLGLSQTEYETIVRRFRRKARALLNKEKGDE